MPGPTRSITPLVGEPNSINANINSLVLTTQWATGNLTYSFPTDGAQFSGYNAGEEPSTGFEAAGAPYKAAALFAFRTAAEFTNATFTEIAPSATNPATMRFGITADPSPKVGTTSDAAGWGYLPADTPNAGDVWIVARQNINTAFPVGDFRWSLVIHEIGHVLGLGHPFEKGASGGDVVMDPARDSTEYTIMAYRASTSVPSVNTVGYPEAGGEPQTWMMYDVAALQAIYGANYNTRSGNTTYSWDPATGQFFIDGKADLPAPGINRILMNVWDGGGTDTYDFSKYTTDARVDLRPGEWSAPSETQVVATNTNAATPVKAPGSISNSLLFQGDTRSLIENAIGGSGNDTITGNQARNVLKGNAGNDKIDGGAGLDTAVFQGTRANYTLSDLNTTTKVATVTDGTISRDGIDTLAGIERIRFSDQIIALDTDGNAGQGYRIYQAAFARTPDLPGLSYWVNQLDTKISLRDLAFGFIASNEFKTVYGATPTNLQLVTKFYQNVLGRDGEKAGIDYWVGLLDKGTSVIDVLAGFSEGKENIDKVAPLIGQGITLEAGAFASV